MNTGLFLTLITILLVSFLLYEQPQAQPEVLGDAYVVEPPVEYIGKPASETFVESEATLPFPDTPHAIVESVCELAEFQPGSTRLKMSIFVLGWRRLTSLQRLLTSLTVRLPAPHARVQAVTDPHPHPLTGCRVLRPPSAAGDHGGWWGGTRGAQLRQRVSVDARSIAAGPVR